MKVSNLKKLCEEILEKEGDIEVSAFVSTAEQTLQVESFEFCIEDYEAFDGTKVFELQVNLSPCKREELKNVS